MKNKKQKIDINAEIVNSDYRKENYKSTKKMT